MAFDRSSLYILALSMLTILMTLELIGRIADWMITNRLEDLADGEGPLEAAEPNEPPGTLGTQETGNMANSSSTRTAGSGTAPANNSGQGRNQ